MPNLKIDRRVVFTGKLPKSWVKKVSQDDMYWEWSGNNVEVFLSCFTNSTPTFKKTKIGKQLAKAFKKKGCFTITLYP